MKFMHNEVKSRPIYEPHFSDSDTGPDHEVSLCTEDLLEWLVCFSSEMSLAFELS